MWPALFDWMHAEGIGRGRRWLGGLLCVATTPLGACGETSQHPSAGDHDKAGNAAGGALVVGPGGTAGSGGAGGGGRGQSDPSCPTSQPAFGSPCEEGQSCFYQGSFNACAPPDATYTCVAGKWETKYGPQQGHTCVPEGCLAGNAKNCPLSAPAPGTACGDCSAQASCEFRSVAAQCKAGLWQVTEQPGAGGAAGAGGEAGGEP